MYDVFPDDDAVDSNEQSIDAAEIAKQVMTEGAISFEIVSGQQVTSDAEVILEFQRHCLSRSIVSANASVREHTS
ncbi:MAG: hypothetical protein R3C28_31760 [Pirellulaceae bacterium]